MNSVKSGCCKIENTKVIDSRQGSDLRSIRRRRECLTCKKRFTTYERVEDYELVVLKKNGTIQEFDKGKIMEGMISACQKRNISLEQIEEVVFLLEKELIDSGRREVPSSEIGDLVIKNLYEIDKVAYIRFASVYRSFDNLEEFSEELKFLIKKS
ncbi:transcriptional repressor NrdR [bacterium]|jgi:transcriptional repressor NrdR|nr:transcriptional repressor NrdR [bacterium]MBT3849724.1 transcriptional repressor NrdR [bacterium]MBT4435174.1 transcriptional repressor NrdR [bacterium]MDG2446151.1 transcriptional regulator NrdR [Thermodesulfobacteriota bacterium]|tara:strand:+ start:2269 stop:2733 length:465 start_codon:yes stop_codon:yes gene_type:complete